LTIVCGRTDIEESLAMRIRWGLGPVFVFESIIAARKWQIYVLRSLFVSVLLVGICFAWNSLMARHGGIPVPTPAQRHILVEFGEQLYLCVAVVQVVFVLLAAPAVTAGAICLDRARGTLTHVMVTDLSNTEIVLGKLAARLTPIIGLIAASVPVMAIGFLLGGVIPEAVATLFLSSVAIATLGASLALLISVRVRKSHEVLMVVYAAWFLWLMSLPIWLGLSQNNANMPRPPDWFYMLNPFVLVYAPYTMPARFGLLNLALFLAVTGSMTCLLAVRSVRTLRREPAAERPRSEKWEHRWNAARARFFSWLPSPSLDGNPVLWREWHRNRPSRTARRVWSLYIVGSLFATFIGFCSLVADGITAGMPVLIVVNMFQVPIGLLFLSVMAPTALSEERVRGSLDALMSTPLSTASIVMGKWWGAFRIVPKLALLPALSSIAFALSVPESGLWFGTLQIRPPDTVDRTAAGLLPIAWILAHGAFLTSLGLALATWTARPARAITLSVVYYLAITIGSLFLVEIFIAPALMDYAYRSVATIDNSTPVGQRAWQQAWKEARERVAWINRGLICVSPMAGPVQSAQELVHGFSGPMRKRFWAVQAGLIGVLLGSAAILVGLTIATFDRCIGRMREGPSRQGPSPGAGPRRMATNAPQEAFVVAACGPYDEE
jgi:ABC-type transport system involved in multi-copper enzyme maturation permease subunit